MNELNYRVADINRDFRLKVSGHGINKLVGVSGLVLLVGSSFVNKFVNKAYKSPNDAVYFRLRRGLKVTLYFK